MDNLDAAAARDKNFKDKIFPDHFFPTNETYSNIDHQVLLCKNDQESQSNIQAMSKNQNHFYGEIQYEIDENVGREINEGSGTITTPSQLF